MAQQMGQKGVVELVATIASMAKSRR